MKIEKSKCLRVPLRETEKVRKILIIKDLINNNFKLIKKGNFVYFPVYNFVNEFRNYKICKREFEKKDKKIKSFKDITKISNTFKSQLPQSFDIIGNILLIKLPSDLLNFKKEIGNALLETHKNINTVCLTYPVSGELRTRKIEVISGVKKTETIHKEYGLEFFLDIKKTYFSPRLSSERKRITDMVKSNETIVDMFAGIAPFSIMIAKYQNPKIIYAIDKNKYAIKFAKENIKRNKVLDKVETICADSKKIISIMEKKGKKADRIIMNLPFSANLFFKYALGIIGKKAVIHYYDIVKENNIDKKIEELKKIAKDYHFILSNLDIRKIKTYAPREFYIGIDITAKRINMPM